MGGGGGMAGTGTDAASTEAVRSGTPAGSPMAVSPEGGVTGVSGTTTDVTGGGSAGGGDPIAEVKRAFSMASSTTGMGGGGHGATSSVASGTGGGEPMVVSPPPAAPVAKAPLPAAEGGGEMSPVVAEDAGASA